MAVQNFGEFRGSKLWTLQFFGGGKFWTLSFLRVASSGLCFFLLFRHIGKLGGGKKSGTPCTRLFLEQPLVSPMSANYAHCNFVTLTKS